MKEMDPYAVPEGKLDGSRIDRPSDSALHHEDINVRNVGNFQGADFANQRSDDPNMMSRSMNSQGMQFQQGPCYSTACRGARRVMNLAGCAFAFLNSAYDFLYQIKAPYASQTLYVVTIVAVVLRMLVNFAFCSYHYSQWVWYYRPGLSQIGERKYRENERDMAAGLNQDESQSHEEQQSADEIASKKHGLWLYSSMHFLFYTGSFRLLPSVHFTYEMTIAYSIELFMGILPLLFIQILNHTSLESELTGLQSAAIIIKLFSLIVFLIEIIIMIWEIILNRRMRKYKIEGFAKLSEEDRRAKFSKKAAGLGICTFMIYFLIVIVGFGAYPTRV